MEGSNNAPDEVTEAALQAVSEAVELSDRDEGRRPAARRRGLRRRLTGRLQRRAERTERLARIRAALRSTASRSARIAGRGVSASGRWLSDQVLAMAPKLPVRSLSTLRSQFPDHSPDQLADRLIEGATRASGAVGAAVGAWAVLPVPTAAAAEIATETLAVVGIEIKLVAELHEVYGQPVQGGVVERMTSYVGAWAQRRGVSLAPGGLVIAAGSPIARQLQRRLAARAGRSVLSLGPLLTGAVAGALINRSETRKLGHALRDDLRKRSRFQTGWPTASG